MGDFGDVDPTTGLGSNRYTGYGQIDPLAASVANGRITPAQWAAYQNKRRRDAILGTTLTVGSMLGAGPLANAVGIGAGAGTSAGGATGGLGMANTGTWTTSVGAAPGAVGGIGAANTGVWTSGVGAAPTGGKMGMSAGTSTVAAAGVNAAANLFGAKKGASSADKSAKLQSDALTKSAELQSGSAAAQLAYLREKEELDRLSKRFTDRQNFYLSKAGMDNDFARYGDTSFNTRASERSLGKTNDNIYGGRERQKNFMREMLGMPENPLSVYVEPDALQLTRPTMPDYVEDPTPTRIT